MLNKFLNFITEKTLAQGGPVNQLAPLGPTQSSTQISSISEYIQIAFPIFLGVAISLAVVMVTWGGLQHILSMKPGGKSEGTERIKSALWGLLLALVAWIILNEINPSINSLGSFGGV